MTYLVWACVGFFVAYAGVAVLRYRDWKSMWAFLSIAATLLVIYLIVASLIGNP